MLFRSGWRINEWTLASGVAVRFVVPGGVVLGPGCHYLMAFRPEVAGVVPDAKLPDPINDNVGLALQRPDGTLADQVGLHPASVYREGPALAPMLIESSRSYTRVGNDTNDNVNDFVLQARTPSNRMSSCAVR